MQHAKENVGCKEDCLITTLAAAITILRRWGDFVGFDGRRSFFNLLEVEAATDEATEFAAQHLALCSLL